MMDHLHFSGEDFHFSGEDFKVRNSSFCAVLAVFLCVSTEAFAAAFSWTPTTSGIVSNEFSLVQTVDGVTVTAQGFVAEITGPDATVYGPFPTKTGNSVPRPQAGFGIDLRGLGGEQLGLIANSFDGVTLNGSDWGSAVVAPGFNSFYWSPIDAPDKFDFAIFAFDEPVDIGSVIVDDTSNFDRDIWMATGTNAPDFSAGFLSGISAFTVVNSADDAGDGMFTHPLGAEGISYLLVGAPPVVALGPLDAGNSQFYIDSFSAVAAEQPIEPPNPVPSPGTLPLLLMGLAALFGFEIAFENRRSRSL
jgi:hypothetical protein